MDNGQWRSKALRGPGSTATWGPSIPSAGPQGLKLEARSVESGGGALGREGLLPGLGSGVSRQTKGVDSGAPRSSGPRFIEPPEPAVSTPLVAGLHC